MSIAMFAIIGSIIRPGTGYWLIFSAYCALKLLQLSASIVKHAKEM